MSIIRRNRHAAVAATAATAAASWAVVTQVARGRASATPLSNLALSDLR